jgi:pyruvate kinase
VSIDYPFLAESAKPGNRILLDDGNLELLVTGVDKAAGEVRTQVVLNGTLKPNKGVNLPGMAIRLPGLTPKDLDDLAFGLALGVDAVAVSFVRTVHDVLTLRDEIERRLQDRPSDQQRPLIIAKLERPEALDNLQGIVEAADGVMVARGDLGVEMSPDFVPIAQKQIIETANRHAKIVITATQMLESMITNPRPTRAEASDVANAIFDGTDAVMLSGETATGKYPVQTVQMMAGIAQRAEDHLKEWGRWGGNPDAGNCDDDTYYITQAAFSLAQDRNVAALVVFTTTGRSARLLSKHRPPVPVLAFTPHELTYNQLNLYWGVQAFMVPTAYSMEEMLAVVDKAMLETSLVQPGQQVVITCGYPIGVSRVGNLALLHTVGE